MVRAGAARRTHQWQLASRIRGSRLKYALRRRPDGSSDGVDDSRSMGEHGLDGEEAVNHAPAERPAGYLLWPHADDVTDRLRPIHPRHSDGPRFVRSGLDRHLHPHSAGLELGRERWRIHARRLLEFDRNGLDCWRENKRYDVQPYGLHGGGIEPGESYALLRSR